MLSPTFEGKGAGACSGFPSQGFVDRAVSFLKIQNGIKIAGEAPVKYSPANFPFNITPNLGQGQKA
jgi:hypothetical protein